MVFLFLDIQRYNRTIHIYHPHTYHSKPYLILHRSRTEETACAQGYCQTSNHTDDEQPQRTVSETRLADDRRRVPFSKQTRFGTGRGATAADTDTERKYVYGILGIAKLFGCSLPTANRIKKSGKIDKAITQIGRKIIVDAELALELAGKKTGGRR